MAHVGEYQTPPLSELVHVVSIREVTGQKKGHANSMQHEQKQKKGVPHTLDMCSDQISK